MPAGARSTIHSWINRNGFISILVTALLPPPTPFKVFVIGAGALKMPVRSFVLGVDHRAGSSFSCRGIFGC